MKQRLLLQDGRHKIRHDSSSLSFNSLPCYVHLLCTEGQAIYESTLHYVIISAAEDIHVCYALLS
jgi:hypothetical protein